MERCEWPSEDKDMIEYHDKEWGTPCHDDKKLFEYFVLDTFQAGLSWKTILKKRKNFEKAFHGFNAKKVARFSDEDFKRLMNDVGIVRNKLKILGSIENAKRFLEIQKELGSFDKYIWKFVNHKPIVNKFKTIRELPATSKESDAMSKELKERGFKFVGSTICYAFMQGAGLVNDHVAGCFRHKEVQK